MIPTRIEVEGLAELERRLLQLGEAAAVKILRSALRRSAKSMIAAAKAKVPYDVTDDDGYHLRDYMKLQLEPKRTRTTPAEFRLGPARRVEAGRIPPVFGGLGRTVRSPNYALEVEKRTPYLRPAFDEGVNGLLSTFKELLSKGIEREMQRRTPPP